MGCISCENEGGADTTTHASSRNTRGGVRKVAFNVRWAPQIYLKVLNLSQSRIFPAEVRTEEDMPTADENS